MRRSPGATPDGGLEDGEGEPGGGAGVGRQTERLLIGDSAQFAGDVAHGYANPAIDGPAARFCLTVGDSAAFAGDVAHGYATPADAAGPARFALTVFQPHVTGSRS